MYKTLLLLILVSGISLYSCAKEREIPDEVKPDVRTEDVNKEEKTPDGTAGNESKSPDGIKNLKYGISTIPSSLKEYKGKPVMGASWEDGNGENVIVITETEVTEKPGGIGTQLSKELYGYHYIMNGDEAEELWKIQDFVKECEFDLTLEYLPESLTITDLNDNGIAESTFLYRLTCKSDVSPDDMKLMMHEGKNKYALRGYNEVTGIGGDYTVDKAFNDAPDSFLDYAKKEWEKFKVFEY